MEGGEAMIEFDVDMNYLIEEGELDRVVLNDENGEHEPMTFWPSGGECEIVEHYVASTRGEIGRERVKLSCGHIVERHSKFCQECGAKIRGAVKR